MLDIKMFTSKPELSEAVRITKENLAEVAEWACESVIGNAIVFFTDKIANIGDWIFSDGEGNLEVLKDDDVELFYDKVK